MALGLLIALVQRYGPRWVGWIIQIYIEVIRGTPFLVQLFVLYYGGPLIGLRLDALPAGLLGLTIYGSPYFAEIFRSAFARCRPASLRPPAPSAWPKPRSIRIRCTLALVCRRCRAGQLLDHPDQGDGDPVDHHRAGTPMYEVSRMSARPSAIWKRTCAGAVLLGAGRNHFGASATGLRRASPNT